jgi:hypothetical protein
VLHIGTFLDRIHLLLGIFAIYALPVSAEQTIRSAIATRTPLALSYDGDSGAIRTVHPHVLYVTSTGKICVDSYQVSGPSSSGNLPNWRPFDLTKIQRLSVLGGSFEIAPGLNLASPKYADGVLAHV